MLTQKEKVLRALAKGPQTTKQLETTCNLVKASAVVAKLRNDGFMITNREFAWGRGRTCNKYVLI